MIRAYRFVGKLGFKITARTEKLIPELLPLLRDISAARMYEEFNKLFLTGHGLKSFEILLEKDALHYLLLEMGTLITEPEFIDFVRYALVNSDTRYHEGKRNMPHFLYAAMLWPLVDQLATKMQTLDKYCNNDPTKNISIAANIILNKQNTITMIPFKALEDIKNIWLMQAELEKIKNINNPEPWVWQGIFRASLEFFVIRAQLDDELKPIAESWTQSYEFYVPPEKRSRKSITNEDRAKISHKFTNQEATQTSTKEKRSSKKKKALNNKVETNSSDSLENASSEQEGKSHKPKSSKKKVNAQKKQDNLIDKKNKAIKEKKISAKDKKETKLKTKKKLRQEKVNILEAREVLKKM